MFPLSIFVIASCLETNFPEIPFSKPSCFHFWLFSYSVIVLFVFWLSVFMFFLNILFWLCLLFWFQIMIKHYFPCNSSVSFVYCWLKGYLFSDLCFVIGFLVGLFASFLNMTLECFMCVLSFSLFENTRLDCFLVWILLSLVLVCFQLSFVFVFHSYQNHGHGQNLENQKCRKTSQNVSSVSAVVFTNSVPIFWGWALKMHNCAENTIKVVVSAKIKITKNDPPPQKKNYPNLEVKNWFKHMSKTGLSMLRNMLGPILTYEHGQF